MLASEFCYSAIGTLFEIARWTRTMFAVLRLDWEDTYLCAKPSLELAEALIRRTEGETGKLSERYAILLDQIRELD